MTGAAARLLEIVSAGTVDAAAVTRLLPAMMAAEQAGHAGKILACLRADSVWLPEALMMFNATGLSLAQEREMVRAVFPALADMPDDGVRRLAACNAALGRYGFSFPQWRFIAQRYAGGRALIEQYGMARLERPTDLRDASLPPGDPARDAFGTGFARDDGDWTVEYRRAYVLCASRDPDRQAAVVIRNSSYFFGRDRLPSPVYVSFDPLSRDDARGLSAADFSGGGRFVPWRDALPADDAAAAQDKVARVHSLLRRLDDEDMRISQWLVGDGRDCLADFIRDMSARAQGAGRAPFYLAAIDAEMPPWFLHASAPATQEALDAPWLTALPGRKIVLLSGPDGDFPVKPAVPAPSGTGPRP